LQNLDLMFSQSLVLSRFEGAGVLTEEQADEIEWWPGARLRLPSRCALRPPHGVFQFSHIPIATESTGTCTPAGGAVA
jgi:hypothetical protein